MGRWMSWRAGALVLAVAVPGSFVSVPPAAAVTVSQVWTYSLSGRATGNVQLNTHVDTGSYAVTDGLGALGIGHYRFVSTYSGSGCGPESYTGTARLVRSDGATLSGTLTGQGQCEGDSRLGISEEAAGYTLKLTSGTGGELVGATLTVNCDWPTSVSTSGGTGAESCEGDGTGTISSRIGYATANDRGFVDAAGGLALFDEFQTPAPTPMKLAMTPSRDGYWLVDAAGHVHVNGDAKWFGNASSLASGETVRGIAPTPSGDGYWMATSLGRVLPFGSAAFHGDLHTIRLRKPIVDLAAAPDGKGYWMAAADGGVFAFGSARFFGSTAAVSLNQPVVGFAPTADGQGYWLAAADGGVFAFGDARFRGSMAAARLNAPVIGVARYGAGYLLAGADNGIFNFGTHPFFGTLVAPTDRGEPAPFAPIVAVAAVG